MRSITRKDLILLILGLGPNGPSRNGVNGITRLQKLIFLLEQEEHVRPSKDQFDFTPYKAGPYSPKIYDDLEMLENLGFVESEVTGVATDPDEIEEVEMLSFEDLIGDGGTMAQGVLSDGLGAADAFEEKRFRLTEIGLARMQSLLENGEYEPAVQSVSKIQQRHGRRTLKDLLYYVYTRYPEMTTRSEIKDKVLRRGY